MQPDVVRRSELRRFLKARRAAAQPPPGLRDAPRRRRRSGLRIEEVCALADVSSSWYGALESGKPIGIALRTLERIADALQLHGHDREHLFALALPAPSRAQPAIGVPVRALLDGFVAGPAMLVDNRLGVLAFNSLARIVYGFTADANAPANSIPWRVFTDPDRLKFYTNWPEHAARVAGILRRNYARAAGDAAFEELVQRLLAHSSDFRSFWERVEVHGPAPLRKRLFIPGIGDFTLDITVLPLPASTESLIFQTALTERDAACIRALADLDASASAIWQA